MHSTIEKLYLDTTHSHYHNKIPANHVFMSLFKHPNEIAAFCTFIIQKRYNEVHPQPQILQAYLAKILRITQIPLSVVFLGLYYLDDLYKRYPHLNQKHSYSTTGGVMTGMLTTALILANHFLDDHAYSNKTWSEVTGIPVKMINLTQRQFLSLLDHQLNVKKETFYSWVEFLYQMYKRVPFVHFPSVPIPSNSFYRQLPQASRSTGSIINDGLPSPISPNSKIEQEENSRPILTKKRKYSIDFAI